MSINENQVIQGTKVHSSAACAGREFITNTRSLEKMISLMRSCVAELS